MRDLTNAYSALKFVEAVALSTDFRLSGVDGTTLHFSNPSYSVTVVDHAGTSPGDHRFTFVATEIRPNCQLTRLEIEDHVDGGPHRALWEGWMRALCEVEPL